MGKNAKALLLLCLIGLFSCAAAQQSSQATPLASEPEPATSEPEPATSEPEPATYEPAQQTSEPTPQPSSQEAEPQERFVYRKKESDEAKKLAQDDAKRLSGVALADMAELLTKQEGNAVMSPASYLLAVAGLSSVSAIFPNAAFGIEDGVADLEKLLTAWNYESQYQSQYDGERYTRLTGAIAHQQVGPTYRFDEAKRQRLSSHYVNTIVSDLDSYHEDATEFFHDELGFTIPVPDPGLTQDGVLTYGGFKMKDYIPGGLYSTDVDFLGEKVDGHSFGSLYFPKRLAYYETADYQVFSYPIAHSELVFILPSEDKNLEDVSLVSAFDAFQANKKYEDVIGTIPYFHARTLTADITAQVTAKLNGNEVFYDALLEDDVVNDLTLAGAFQSSDFAFNRYGVEGESITVMVAAGTAMPEEHVVKEVYVDRPFYAVSTKDGFPLFVNRIETIERK